MNTQYVTLLTSLIFSTLSIDELWRVNDDGKAYFNTIQTAADVASNGEKILLFSGTYTETDNQVVDILGKAITLRSYDGPSMTIIYEPNDTKLYRLE
tara:strand:- start:293 stop:583 length:291 start_codon:yes stop_codon:yes gene_type:complete